MRTIKTNNNYNFAQDLPEFYVATFSLAGFCAYKLIQNSQKNLVSFLVSYLVSDLVILYSFNASELLKNSNFSIGEVAEWLKAAVSKTVIGATLSRVRIPPSPLPLR